jgi:hypothetical protein
MYPDDLHVTSISSHTGVLHRYPTRCLSFLNSVKISHKSCGRESWM